MAKMKFIPVVDNRKISDEEREARWELWRRGDLSWKLDECQEAIYNLMIDQIDPMSIGLISRRFGKSFVALIVEIEACIQNPYIICKHACPTQKMVKEMIYPQLQIIFHDAPPEFELSLLWNGTEGKLKFPNNSFIGIAGTDGNNADNLRGTYCHIATCDEAGFMDNLEYVVRNILRPQLLTTGGKLNMISTPNPRELNHEFHTKFVFPAEASGKILKLTIWDNKRLTEAQIRAEIASYPLGEDDPGFRVEYLVEIPKVTENNVIKEFALNKENIVVDDETLQIPPFKDFYVGGDVGVRDLTAYLFGYYDFKTATVVILDEWVMNGKEMTTNHISEAIRTKEMEHFVEYHGVPTEPFKRVMDNSNLQMINDLNKLHGIRMVATKKDGLIAAVNQVRILAGEGRLKIHKRCKNLLYQIEYGQWKKSTGEVKEFANLEASADGTLMANHLDCLSALIYLIRNVNMNKNPYPEKALKLNENQHMSVRGRESSQENSKMNTIKSIFGLNKRGK